MGKSHRKADRNSRGLGKPSYLQRVCAERTLVRHNPIISNDIHRKFAVVSGILINSRIPIHQRPVQFGIGTLVVVRGQFDEVEVVIMHHAMPAYAGWAQKIEVLAGQRSPVVISGESGTGKLFFARNIHRLGGAPASPLIAGALQALAMA